MRSRTHSWRAGLLWLIVSCTDGIVAKEAEMVGVCIMVYSLLGGLDSEIGQYQSRFSLQDPQVTQFYYLDLSPKALTASSSLNGVARITWECVVTQARGLQGTAPRHAVSLPFSTSKKLAAGAQCVCLLTRRMRD